MPDGTVFSGAKPKLLQHLRSAFDIPFTDRDRIGNMLHVTILKVAKSTIMATELDRGPSHICNL
jgi:hypothetical protein